MSLLVLQFGLHPTKKLRSESGVSGLKPDSCEEKYGCNCGIDCELNESKHRLSPPIKKGA